MVSVFHSGHRIDKAVSYNENKVKNDKAELIMASGYLKDMIRLTFAEKLFRLQRRASLNEQVRANTVHVSLNFDPSEKLTVEELMMIAESYMQKIGFGLQPYLVYQHFDAGHPHLHIVSTNIQSDGSRISLHNIGRNQSERARKEIELEFGLVKASERDRRQQYRENPKIERVQYGEGEAVKSVSEVVRAIVKDYKFTSLAELNAVLKQYNIMADRGSENSFLYRKRGLQYRILDEKGNKKGVPIKASTVGGKPTLKVLEGKFRINELLRKPHKEAIKSKLKGVLQRSDVSTLQQLEKELKKQNVKVVFRQNEQGRIYGITYIDYASKCVFNGSDIGKAYSANAIMERINGTPSFQSGSVSDWLTHENDENISDAVKSNAGKGLLEELLLPERNEQNLSMLPKKKRKKKKRGNQL